MKKMFTSTFTFAPGIYTDEFHKLDQTIAMVAKTIPGYLGEEAWENSASGLVSNVYYWDSLEALQKLMADSTHAVAKQRQAEWLKGFHVVVAEVVGSYGDGRLPHPLAGVMLRPDQPPRSTADTEQQ
jgi:heme-degrading monooxygenase HmoA